MNFASLSEPTIDGAAGAVWGKNCTVREGFGHFSPGKNFPLGEKVGKKLENFGKN